MARFGANGDDSDDKFTIGVLWANWYVILRTAISALDNDRNEDDKIGALGEGKVTSLRPTEEGMDEFGAS